MRYFLLLTFFPANLIVDFQILSKKNVYFVNGYIIRFVLYANKYIHRGFGSNKLQKDISLAGHYRPSPVKFTNEQPVQFPLKPKPERVPAGTKTFETREPFPGHTEKGEILSESSEPARDSSVVSSTSVPRQ